MKDVIKVCSNGTLMKRNENGRYTFMAIPSSKLSYCGIYGIYDKTYDKWYIGSSVDIVTRIEGHKAKFRKLSKEPTDKLMYFLHPCHQNNIEYHILEYCTPEELAELERYYIRTYNSIEPNGYNAHAYTRVNRKNIPINT